MIQEVTTDNIEEIVNTLNEVVRALNELKDKDRYRTEETLYEIESIEQESDDIARIEAKVDKIVQHLQEVL